MATALETRFIDFLTGLPDAEPIDALALPDDAVHTRKADFLLAKRNVIVEIKTITTDPTHKVDVEVDKHRARDDFPLIYGKADLRRTLANLPDGEQIYRRIVNALGRQIEDVVRSAEEQIEHTRRRLDVPTAIGLLVLLNESVEVLDPNVVAHRALQTMRRPRSGRTIWPAVDYCLLIDESNLSAVGGQPCHTILWIENRSSNEVPWFATFKSQLTVDWAGANDRLTIEASGVKPADLRFTSTRHMFEPPPGQMTRQAIWERDYIATPYLRPLSDEALLAYGQRLLERVAPSFIKGRPKPSLQELQRNLEQTAHFGIEMGHRGLDWRRIPKIDLEAPTDMSGPDDG